MTSHFTAALILFAFILLLVLAVGAGLQHITEAMP